MTYILVVIFLTNGSPSVFPVGNFLTEAACEQDRKAYRQIDHDGVLLCLPVR